MLERGVDNFGKLTNEQQQTLLILLSSMASADLGDISDKASKSLIDVYEESNTLSNLNKSSFRVIRQLNYALIEAEGGKKYVSGFKDLIHSQKDVFGAYETELNRDYYLSNDNSIVKAAMKKKIENKRARDMKTEEISIFILELLDDEKS